MKTSGIKVILIILAVVVLGTIVTLGYFIWDFHRPVEYVTRDPAYHEYFPISSAAFVDEFHQYEHMRINLNRAVIIIDVRTGRELMRFQNNRNRRYQNIRLRGDGTVFVNRSLREGVFGSAMRHEYVLFDIESGHELLLFDNEHVVIERVSNGFAFIRKLEGANHFGHNEKFGIMEIESGAITVPFEQQELWHLQNNYAVARIEFEDEDGALIRYAGIIDMTSGEVKYPFQFSNIASISRGARCNLVRFIYYNRDVALVNFTTGEVLISACSPKTVRMFNRAAGYGMAVIRGNWREQALIEIESGRVIIPFGEFSEIQILNENAVIVTGSGGSGIINIHSGEKVVPLGNYLMPSSTSVIVGYYYGNMILAKYNDEQAIIDLTTGEEIIQFGTYNIHRLLPGGFVVVSDGDYWWIEKIQR